MRYTVIQYLIKKLSDMVKMGQYSLVVAALLASVKASWKVAIYYINGALLILNHYALYILVWYHKQDWWLKSLNHGCIKGILNVNRETLKTAWPFDVKFSFWIPWGGEEGAKGENYWDFTWASVLHIIIPLSIFEVCIVYPQCWM